MITTSASHASTADMRGQPPQVGRFAIVASALLSLALTGACGTSDTGGVSDAIPPNASAAVSAYSEVVWATYEDSLSAARELQDRVASLVATPSTATQQAAQEAWRLSREPYLQSEVFRFYEGPIDDPETGPEGRLNAWPLDEEYIDYVATDPTAGIINDRQRPLTADLLGELNERLSEKNISLGYHAIEFLLWGQDTSAEGPGDRPFTDFVVGDGGTAANQDRRQQYLSLATEILVTDLRALVEAWSPSGDNYRAQFQTLATQDALGRILSGMIILSGFETGGERLRAALESQSQEEEHSCFSDNTHRDMLQDIQGVKNVWLGHYRRTDGTEVAGTGLADVVRATDPSLADDVTASIDQSLAKAEALQSRRFDQEILPTNPEGNARVQALSLALFEQQQALERVFRLYGLERIPDPI